MKTKILLLTLAAITICGCRDNNPEQGVKGVEHVVVIGLDGFAGWTADSVDMPFLKDMMKEGAWTVKSRSILPSSSACNWMSMFCGACVEMHGYNTWGSREPDFEPISEGVDGMYPTIAYVIRQNAPECKMGAFYEWDGIEYVIGKQYFDEYKQVYGGENGGALAHATCEYIKAEKPRLVLSIFDTPDHEGHKYGWNSPEYKAALTGRDLRIREIVEATKEAGIYDSTVFFVVSDHGGFENDHGSTLMEHMNGVWYAFGKGVRKGHEVASSVMRFDTAPTIAWIFGYECPDLWRGKPRTEFFEE